MNSPAGLYHSTLKKGVTSKAKSGNPQMCLTFEVTHSWNGEGWDDMMRPIERSVFLSLTDAAWPYSEEKLTRLGFNGNFESPDFTETEADLECKIESYQGKDKEKWDLAGGGSFEPEPAPKDVTRTLSAKWKAKGKPVTSPPPAGRPKAPARPPAAKPKLPEENLHEVAPGEFVDDSDPRHPQHIPY